MDDNRRLPQGSAETKTCPRFEAVASAGRRIDPGPSSTPLRRRGSIAAAPPLPELAAVAPVIQPASEFAPRQCKEIQGKFLASPWIPLAESGLFNGLQRKKDKKTSAGRTRVWGCISLSQTVA
jgi:hypothetical protein